MPGSSMSDLEREGRDLVQRRGGVWTARGGLCRCPAHDDRSPSLSVRVGRKRLLLHCFAGCAAADVLRALRAGGFELAASAIGSGGDGQAAEVSGLDSAIRLWGEARPFPGTPAERYLAGRGIGVATGELRYCRRTPLGPAPLTQFRPALVAAVRDEMGLVAVHRTFLDPGRNRLSAIDGPRRGLGPFGSGAVRLGGVARRIGLAEGIETALSATSLFGLPCWAALGTERFRLVALPDTVTQVVLFLDNDRGGRRAERLARAAFGDRIAGVRFPREAGADWNDVLRARAFATGTLTVTPCRRPTGATVWCYRLAPSVSQARPARAPAVAVAGSIWRRQSCSIDCTSSRSKPARTPTILTRLPTSFAAPRPASSRQVPPASGQSTSSRPWRSRRPVSSYVTPNGIPASCRIHDREATPQRPASHVACGWGGAGPPAEPRADRSRPPGRGIRQERKGGGRPGE